MSESSPGQRLDLYTLGGLTIKLYGHPNVTFSSRKMEALLVYLACSGRPQPREVLAELLWDERSPERALGNLRWTLHGLRKCLNPYLEITRQTIALRSDQVWLDVAELEAQRHCLQVGVDGLSSDSLGELQTAVDLYQGEFMQGFKVRGGKGFEDWVSQERERLHLLVLDSLQLVAIWHQQNGQFATGIYYANRMLQLDPYAERVHRLKMLLLTNSGQPGATLSQYEYCFQLLMDNLGISPSEETTSLYEQIQAGQQGVPTHSSRSELLISIHQPGFIDDKGYEIDEQQVFVGQEGELAQLMGVLNTALDGHSRVVFITGGPGRGKTTLMREFARRASAVHSDLIVVGGKGNAYTGIGDPYLPFREVLRLLTGDLEFQPIARILDNEQARRLWNFLPYVVHALLEVGPDLIGTFLSGAALLSRAKSYTPIGADWVTSLSELVERRVAFPHDPTLQQSALHLQYTRVLKTLSRYHPLLLVLDDLQWADIGSIGLLFYLGQVIATEPIMLIGAYRPEEIALGRPSLISGQWSRHPLEALINEFRRRFEDIEIDMTQSDGWQFVNDFLDTEPNRLGASFRKTLHQQTQGHPLFTVELLRGLQERGDLILDESGRWAENLALDWETLPSRVEAVIAERIERLEQSLQETLRVASVEGEVFTAEVLAQVQAIGVDQMLPQLSNELSRRHRLVGAKGYRIVNEQRLSQYQFRHILFLKYLYNSMDEAECANLHERVGRALETLYGTKTEVVASIAPQLARHFQHAGIIDKSIGYLQQSGERALRMSANESALDYLTQALVLLATLPDSLKRAEFELALQLKYAMPLQSIRGYAAPEVGRLYTRLHELCEILGETPMLFPVLWLAHSYYTVRADLQEALETAEQLLDLAERAEDPVLVAMAQWALGWIQRCRGKFEPARTYLEQVIAWYDQQQHHFLTFIYAQDPGVVSRSQLSVVLWLLGYPDQALELSQEALALARELAHPFSIAFALLVCAAVYSYHRDAPMCQKLAEELIDISIEYGFVHWLALGNTLRGYALILQEKVEDGIAQASQGIADYRSTGAALDYSLYLAGLIEGYMKAGCMEESAAILTDALAFVEETGERYGEAELRRLQGELLHMQGADETEVERYLWHGIEVARCQRARSWELRVTVTLCRLWKKHGMREKARQLLAEIYGWFNEGFETEDLREARALLEELS